MPGSTRYYGIGFFDFGDPLGTDFAGQVEIDRFVFIDKMLFGLMSIFGNGVVNGWVIAAEESFRVSISEGFGNINFRAGRTTFPATISELPANSIFYIYAKNRIRTSFTEEIEFIFDGSPTLSENDFNFLLLAKVTTGNVSVESVDNSVRQEIGFIELIKAAIRLHKHRGGSLNPSKIDLTSEVKGQIPSFRIADFDAEKITTGTFDLERIPLLDHQDLQNVGLLTHPQLDTFVKTLEASNTELFGEIGTANLLQLIIAAKLIYEDPESAFFTGVQIDENMINEFAVIPGITSNDRIDFDNTTAEVDLEQHFIKGVPPTTGTSFFVNFDTALAWNAQSLTNLLVTGDTLGLAFDPDQTTTTTIIEGFESSTEPGQDLTDSGTGLFVEQTLIIVDSATIESNSNSTDVTQGFFSGQFSHKQSFRVQFVKQFSTAQDWTEFDTFELDVRCLSNTHGAVKFFFADSAFNATTGAGLKSVDYSLLEQDQVTGNFETRTIDLTELSFRNDIKSIVIFSDDHTNVFTYIIDNMRIKKSVLLPEEGVMNLRYSAGGPVTFSTIEWTSTEPSGTELEVRARSANGSVLLNRATFTDFLNSGDNVNLDGTDLQVEFTFLPNTARTQGPILSSVRILILTQAEIDGFAIDTTAEFSRGTSENTVITSNVIQLDTPIFVDSIYYALHNSVNQGTIQSGGEFTSENAIFGTSDAPVSPNQVFKSVEDSLAAVFQGFTLPRSVRRQIKRSFVIADTFNDRVMEFDEDGNLLAGIGSINYEVTGGANSAFPIAACVDTRTSILYVVWSKKVAFKTVNVSKITIQSNTQVVQLIKDFDKILGLTTAELQKVSAEGQIMPVFLSSQNAGLAETLPKTNSFLQVDGSTENGAGVIPGGIDRASIFYTTAAIGLGIQCYIGKFAYIDGIFSPTYADRSLAGGFIIANGTIAVKDYDFSGNTDATDSGAAVSKVTNISDIIEVDENNNVIFGVNTMKFSPFIPGRVKEMDKSTLLIGGIRPGGESGIPDNDTPLDFRSIGGDDSTVSTQKSVLDKIFFGSSNPHFGSVVLYDRSINSTVFEYTSAEGILVSDVDTDSLGQYVIAESSLDRSGRIIKLDTSGNIIFSIGEGVYGLINGISVQIDDSIIIST